MYLLKQFDQLLFVMIIEDIVRVNNSIQMYSVINLVGFIG